MRGNRLDARAHGLLPERLIQCAPAVRDDPPVVVGETADPLHERLDRRLQGLVLTCLTDTGQYRKLGRHRLRTHGEGETWDSIDEAFSSEGPSLRRRSELRSARSRVSRTREQRGNEVRGKERRLRAAPADRRSRHRRGAAARRRASSTACSAESATPMSDGFPTPARSDGMAAFNWRGLTRLVRNHEVLFEVPAHRPGRQGVRQEDRRRHDDPRGQPRTASSKAAG